MGITKKRITNNEKRKTKNEMRKTKSEKRKAKNEKRKTNQLHLAAVTPVRLEPATPRSTTELLRWALCEDGNHVGRCVPQILHNKQWLSYFVNKLPPLISNTSCHLCRPTRNRHSEPSQLQRPSIILTLWVYQIPLIYFLDCDQQRRWSYCALDAFVVRTYVLQFQFFLITLILTLKAPRKKCIWKCRLLKSSAANNCLTLLTNSV